MLSGLDPNFGIFIKIARVFYSGIEIDTTSTIFTGIHKDLLYIALVVKKCAGSATQIINNTGTIDTNHFCVKSSYDN
jgi:hypothetical protein